MKNNTPLKIFFAIIAICVAITLIVCYLPLPVMRSGETILGGDEIPVIGRKNGVDDVIATISKYDLEAILKNSKCLRISRGEPRSAGIGVCEIYTRTNKGPFNIYIEVDSMRQVTSYMTNNSKSFVYQILDSQAVYERLVDVFHYE